MYNDKVLLFFLNSDMNDRLPHGSIYTGIKAPAQSDGSYYQAQLLSDGRFRIAKNTGGSFGNWNDFLTNADLEFHEATKITLGRYSSYGTTVINIDSTDGEEYQLVASDQDLKYQKKIKNSSGYNTIWSITP